MASGEVQQSAAAAKETAGKGYLSESLAELRKVTSPTRQEALQATVVTLIIMMFMAFCLFILDWFFHLLVTFLIA